MSNQDREAEDRRLKILIVDDESVSQIKLQAVLEEFGACLAVSGGREAIAEVKKALDKEDPYDLITIDISMPEMDGSETLFEIRELERKGPSPEKNRAKVIMVTAQSDRDSLITCVQAGCDDYIIKPFDPDQIVQRLVSLKLPGVEEWVRRQKENLPPGEKPVHSEKVAVGQEVLSLFKRGEISLPSPPDIYNKFKAMAEQGADLSDIADILKEDMSISFHLISVSNSPVYRGNQENRNLRQAIGRLGLEMTAKYVDMLANRSLFTIANRGYQPIMDELWQHSLACANAAEILVAELGLKMEHDPFTLGILHDVGKMVLIQIMSELESRGTIPGDTNRYDVLSALDAYHGPFGEAVLGQWNFPEVFGTVARHHDDLDMAPSADQALLVVQLANLIAKSTDFGYNGSVVVDAAASQPAVLLGAGLEIIERVKQRLTMVMEETRQAMG